MTRGARSLLWNLESFLAEAFTLAFHPLLLSFPNRGNPRVHFNDVQFFLFLDLSNHFWGFPGYSMGRESACNAGDPGDLGSIPGWWKIPWRRPWRPTPVFFAWKISRIEEPGGLQSIESQSQTRLKGLSRHVHDRFWNTHSIVFLKGRKTVDGTLYLWT